MDRRTGVVLAASLALFAAACGKKEEQVASGTFDAGGKQGSYAVTRDGDGGSTMTVKSGAGEAVIKTGAGATESLPPGLSLYPGAKLTSSTSVSGQGAGQAGGLLAFESADPADRIVAWYKDAAARAGYSVDSEMTMNDMAMMSAKRTDGQGFQLIVNRADGKSVATLIGGGKG